MLASPDMGCVLNKIQEQRARERTLLKMLLGHKRCFLSCLVSCKDSPRFLSGRECLTSQLRDSAAQHSL